MERTFLLEQVRERNANWQCLETNRALDRAFAAVADCDYGIGDSDMVSREDLHHHR